MKNNILHRKDRLIITAIEIIDELGLQGLSTREIAKRDGVSEATLFRHYKSKNELLGAILDFFSKFDLDIYETTKIKNLPPLEAIRFFVSSTVEYYENYPAITALTQMMDALRYEAELSDKVKTIIFSRSNSIQQLVEKAKITGELKKDIDNEILADTIIGTVREICLKWRISKNFQLKERAISSVNILLNVLSQ